MVVVCSCLLEHAPKTYAKKNTIGGTAIIDQIQSHEVAGRELNMRTEASHDHDLNVVKQGEKESQCGPTGLCSQPEVGVFSYRHWFPT